MKYIKPKKLKKGDLIGVISPASTSEDNAQIEKGIKYIEAIGYRTIIGKSVGKQHGYLAGTDEERFQDIHDMFANKKVKAIFCLRGGYGAFRLLDKIDYKLIRRNPKIFVGFSEITSLQMAFLAKSKLMAFAGPMVLPNFSSEISSFTEDNFWSMLKSSRYKPTFKLKDDQIRISNKTSSGKLVGGNLAVLAGLFGSEYLPDFNNKILLLEEINEPPYKIDRMLNQLRLNKVFDNLNGIILGNFIDCVEPDKGKKTLELNDVLSDYLSRLDIPVVYDFPFGHSKDIVTLPIGCKVKLNAEKGIVEFLESGVT